MTDATSLPHTPPRNHRWMLEARIPAVESHDGNGRTEKQCPFCGLWKITVHFPNGFPQRKWRWRDGPEFGGARPLCAAAPSGEIEGEPNVHGEVQAI